MRQTKRIVNKVFPLIILVLLISSVVVYIEGDLVKPFFSSLVTTKQAINEKNTFAKQDAPVEEKLEIVAESPKTQVVTTAKTTVLGASSGGCPNPNGTCVSQFVNNYLVDDAKAIKYKDIAYRTNELIASVKIGKDDPSGGQLHMCGISGSKDVAIAMKLKESPILPNFYKKGIENGLPARQENGSASENRAYVSSKDQVMLVAQLPEFCRYNSSLFRTEATYGVEPKLGTTSDIYAKGSPFFWKSCAALTGARPPQTDASKDTTWNHHVRNDADKKYVAYKMGWADPSGYPAEAGTKGIYGPYGWAFDSLKEIPSVGSDASLTDTFELGAPPKPSGSTGTPRDALLARSTLSLDFVDKSVLDLIFSYHGYIFKSQAEKDSNVRLSYNPTTQKEQFCDYEKGECPLVPGEASCSSPLWLEVTAKPGILQMSTTPDYITNASLEKSMQRAMTNSLSSFTSPNSIFERATKEDIILAGAQASKMEGCGSLSKSPNLTDKEFEELKKYYKYNDDAGQSVAGSRDKGAAIFYKMKAEFKGEVNSEFLGFIAHPNFDGDVIAFTVIPIQNLTEYANFYAPNETYKNKSTQFRETILTETGFKQLQYKIKCSGGSIELNFEEIY